MGIHPVEPPVDEELMAIVVPASMSPELDELDEPMTSWSSLVAEMPVVMPVVVSPPPVVPSSDRSGAPRGVNARSQPPIAVSAISKLFTGTILPFDTRLPAPKTVRRITVGVPHEVWGAVLNGSLDGVAKVTALYRQLHRGIWQDKDVQTLTPESKLVWVWLLCNEHDHFSGLYRIYPVIIAAEIGISVMSTTNVLEELRQMGLIEWDGVCLVWVKNMLKFQGVQTAPFYRSVAAQLALMSPSPIVDAFQEHYGEWLEACVAKGFANTRSMGHPMGQLKGTHGIPHPPVSVSVSVSSVKPESLLATHTAKSQNGIWVGCAREVKQAIAAARKELGVGGKYREPSAHEVKAVRVAMQRGPYTVEDLLAAVNAAKESNRKDTDNARKYLTMETLLRPANLDRYVAWADDGAANSAPAKSYTLEEAKAYAAANDGYLPPDGEWIYQRGEIVKRGAA